MGYDALLCVEALGGEGGERQQGGSAVSKQRAQAAKGAEWGARETSLRQAETRKFS
jgi:hypothetical protein